MKYLSVTVEVTLMAAGGVEGVTPRHQPKKEENVDSDGPVVILGRELSVVTSEGLGHAHVATDPDSCQHSFLKSLSITPVLEGIEWGVDIVYTNPQLGRSILRNKTKPPPATTTAVATAPEISEPSSCTTAAAPAGERRSRGSRRRTRPRHQKLQVHFAENTSTGRKIADDNRDDRELTWTAPRPVSPPPPLLTAAVIPPPARMSSHHEIDMLSVLRGVSTKMEKSLFSKVDLGFGLLSR